MARTPSILDRVDLTVAPGSRWGVVGENGRGKSTLPTSSPAHSRRTRARSAATVANTVRAFGL